jgi:hypothetical protein
MGIEEGSVPDEYLCELCLPREVDVQAARQKQKRRRMADSSDGGRDEPMPVKPTGRTKVGEGSRSNGKTSSSMLAGEEHASTTGLGSLKDPTGSDGKLRRKSGPAPSTLASTPLPIPASKSRRTNNLLRDALQPSIQSPTTHPASLHLDMPSTPTFAHTSSTSTPIDSLDSDEEEYSLEPWSLEYIPIRESVVRDPNIREMFASVVEDWSGPKEEPAENNKHNDDTQMDIDEPLLPIPEIRPPSPPPLSPQPQATKDPDSLDPNSQTNASSEDEPPLDPPPSRPSSPSIPSATFSVLGPLLPPVHLSGSSILSIASKTSVKSVPESSITYPQSFSASHPALPSTSIRPAYSRPAAYALFADSSISKGSFVGEYKGEILDGESYRQDPINQYGLLGLPKPAVRAVGPPFDLVIDSRGFGNELRFVRSGCHPNVVIRPALFSRVQDPDSTSADGSKASTPCPTSAPEFVFGLFASKDIMRRDEIMLPWEWDDSHVIHALLPLLEAKTSTSPVSPTFPSESFLVPKFDAVLAQLAGTFASCACEKKKDCAVAQMGRIVEGKGFLGLVEKTVGNGRGGRRPKKPDLGELVGAVRGWRRKAEDKERKRREELEAAAAFAAAELVRVEMERQKAREAFEAAEREASARAAAAKEEEERLRLEREAARERTEQRQAAINDAFEDDGNLSDASTLTEPLSHFSSDSPSDDDSEPDTKSDDDEQEDEENTPPSPVLSSPLSVEATTPKVAKRVIRRRVNNRVESESPPTSPRPSIEAGAEMDVDEKTPVLTSTDPFDPWAAEFEPNVPPPVFPSHTTVPPSTPPPRPATPPLLPPKEPTPPKSPTPPPKSPTPPPVTKRLSLKDWALRRKANPQPVAVVPPPVVLEDAPKVEIEEKPGQSSR